MCDILIIFSDTYATGVTIVDDQHKGLVGVINTLFYHMRRQDGWGITLPVLKLFKSYADIHYTTEKLALDFCDNECCMDYDIQHEILCKRLINVESKCRFDNSPQHLLSYMKSWWTGHMDTHREFFLPVEEEEIARHLAPVCVFEPQKKKKQRQPREA